ncbi:MAG: protein kinase [Nitrospirae bacterium]|nr:protein kinase [Candidatus Manganitrophaceae bacterium]
MSLPAPYGKYLLIDKIAKGGMAEVYLAKQIGLKGFERLLAIKRILPQFTENAEFVSMFINEAKVAAQLAHPNIVQIYDFGEIEASYYIGMEYIMGRDLRTILERSQKVNRPLSIDQILFVISRVCSGLEHAHKKKDLHGNDLNLVHRDISPQNILISYEGDVKLVDFGIAKAALQENETRTGILKGKLAYMSPEQAWGKPIDHRSDLFSLGIVLHESLTGRRLFKGDSEINTLERVREAKFDSPRLVNSNVTEQVEAALAKALAKEVDQRYPSAGAMQNELERCLSKPLSEIQTELAQLLRPLFAEEINQDQSRMKRAALATSEPTPVQAVAGGTPSPLLKSPAPFDPKFEAPKRRMGTGAITLFLVVGALGLVGVGTVVLLKKGEEPEVVVARAPLPAAGQAAPSPLSTPLTDKRETGFKEVESVASKEPPASPSTASEPIASTAAQRTEEKPIQPARIQKVPAPKSKTASSLNSNLNFNEAATPVPDEKPALSSPTPPISERKKELPPLQESVTKEAAAPSVKQEPIKEAALHPAVSSAARPPAPSDEELIREVIKRQEIAFENKDLNLYLKDWMKFSQKDEKEVQTFFDQYETLSVQFDITDIQIRGNQAALTMNQSTELKAKKGKKVQTATSKVSWGLVKEGSIWKINDTKILDKK